MWHLLEQNRGIAGQLRGARGVRLHRQRPRPSVRWAVNQAMPAAELEPCPGRGWGSGQQLSALGGGVLRLAVHDQEGRVIMCHRQQVVRD